MHWLIGRIRKALILGRRPVPCTFVRRIETTVTTLTVTDELRNNGRLRFRRLLLGGEIPVRYVPQSRFFQPHELQSEGNLLSPSELDRVNRGEHIRRVRNIPLAADLPAG